ncbi:MAG: hypothetical protein R3F23_00065 [Verrucomicrobiia bacterium]
MGLGRWLRRALRLSDEAAILAAKTTAKAEVKAAGEALDLAKDVLKTRKEVLTREFRQAIPARVDEVLCNGNYYQAVQEAEEKLRKLQMEGGSDLAIKEAQEALQLNKDVLETRKAVLTRQYEEGLRADVDEALLKDGHFEDVSKAETRFGDATKS